MLYHSGGHPEAVIGVGCIYHSLLNEEIREYLSKHSFVREKYLFAYKGNKFVLYLDYGYALYYDMPLYDKGITLKR